MREVIRHTTEVGKLISQVSKNAKTFYIGDDVKICLRLEKRCSICRKFYPHNLINHRLNDLLVCDWCRMSAEKIDDGG